ncbi:MAG: HD domain-containing protein [Bacteroidales bacterium]
MSSNSAKKTNPKIDADFEKLITSCSFNLNDNEIDRIAEAYYFAKQKLSGMIYYNGRPRISHPLEVAQIAAEKLGLRTTSIIVALLHDVTKAGCKIEDVEFKFGKEISNLMKDVLKLSSEAIIDNPSIQADLFRKILIYLSDDIRIIYIKLADKLAQLRNIDSYHDNRKYKIVAEAEKVYVPIAHRLGIHSIRTEMEDICLHVHDPSTYRQIEQLISKGKKEYETDLDLFSSELQRTLNRTGHDSTISKRVKSIYSIKRKMDNKHISFDEIYDVLAVRIVFKPKDNNSENAECFEILSEIHSQYPHLEGRVRDWVTEVKNTGYKALHTTIQYKENIYIEVQIRSEKMHEIAEKGFAAHFKYKGIKDVEGELDTNIEKLRESLATNKDLSDDQFKFKRHQNEIFLFTPKGDLKQMPADSSVLDFAYMLNTNLGDTCIGAKVNNMLVEPKSILENGDSIEILTSKKQVPQVNWLKVVKTTKAKKAIRSALNMNDKLKEEGRSSLIKIFDDNNISFNTIAIRVLNKHMNVAYSKTAWYEKIGNGDIEISKIKEIIENFKPEFKTKPILGLNFSSNSSPSGKELLNLKKINAKLESSHLEITECCTPHQGGLVYGEFSENNKLILHATNCEQIKDKKGDKNFISLYWDDKAININFFNQLTIKGFGDIRSANEITNIFAGIKDTHIQKAKVSYNDNSFKICLDLHTQNLVRFYKQFNRVRAMKNVHSISEINKTHL